MVDAIDSIDPKQRIVFTPFLFILGFAASWKNLSSLAYSILPLKRSPHRKSGQAEGHHRISGARFRSPL